MDVRGSRWARLIACAFMVTCLAGASNAFAQGGQTGTLTGTVVDNVGVVPGANVTVTNVSNNTTASAVTNDQGAFRLVSLQPARYTARIAMQGFRQIDIAEFPLSAGENRNLGRLVLQAGGVTETVNVTAEVTPVQTSSSALQKNLTSDLLTSVQVKGRDIFGMLKILPGVMDANRSRDFANWASGRSLAINGGNSLNKNTTIDGVPVGEEGGNGTSYITPNIDSVAEVNVITSGYTAENGRMASGQVAMVTKSGSNEFKGSAWYNGRRGSWMNKNDYIRIKEGDDKPFFAVDISGFSFGGPVIIPKLINSRTSEKKMFFFASSEYTKDIRPTSVQRNALPTALERMGDFSQTFYCDESDDDPCNRDAAGNISRFGSTLPLRLSNPYASQGVTDFFCGVGTGGVTGVPCAGTTTRTSIINPKYFHSIGSATLNLLPLPNFRPNTAEGEAWTSNNAIDALPEHVRKNLVLRVDTVLSQRTRFSVRGLFDRDDNVSRNNIMPGVGNSNNVFPGNLLTATVTQVLRPTVVNEMTFGFAQNHWGFKRNMGPIVASDYTDWYRSSLGIDPPRLAPFGTFREPTLDNDNLDQYPYFPYTTFGGGNAANNGYIRAAGSSGPLPRWNQNYRYTFSDDLTIVRGRHSFKFGFFTERDSKTEPGDQDYVGSYNFSHTSANPFTTGNGYANALIGEFQTYSERDRRLDDEIRHWLTEAYVQDTWRMTPRFTLDYGLRLSHNGALYEARNFNSGFDPSLYNPANAAVLFRPFCASGEANDEECDTNRARNPLTGEVVPSAFAGTVVPGAGAVTNGQFTGGLSGMRAGQYNGLKPMSWGPRVGFAWDVFGDGKTAIRGATGMFYNLFNRSYYGFNGGPLLSLVRTVRYANMDDIDEFVAAGNLAISPASTKVPHDLFPMDRLDGQMIAPTELQAEKHYQGNLAIQRDLGFSTVVEVAWVGNFGRNYRQQKTLNNIPINAFADVANLYDTEGLSANFIRRDWPGIGAVNYDTTDELGLNYNSLQISAQRRLSQGLQMGMAYTLAKGEGMRGWNFLTEELHGAAGLKEVYYGPQTTSDQGQDRRHVLVFNYSYQIPTPNVPVLRYLLGGWEASGVTTIMSGDPINPSCGAADETADGVDISGIANNDPSLTDVGARCEYSGEPLFSGYNSNPTNTNLEEDRIHFNPHAFQRPLPIGTTFTPEGTLGPNPVGNIGNVKWGVLRNPGWSNWDFTLARRLPVKIGRGGNVRVQIQFYNLLNSVQFDQMNASMEYRAARDNGAFGGDNTADNTGQYNRVRNPLNGSVTIRFDY